MPVRTETRADVFEPESRGAIADLTRVRDLREHAPMVGRPLLVATVVALSLARASSAQLVVENLRDGDEVRQATVLLRGRAPTGPAVVTRGGETVFRSPVVGGSFLALVALGPGRNELVLQAGDERTTLTLVRRPATTPFRLRVAYVIANDGRTDYPTQRQDDPQCYARKLDTAVRLMQAFTAEAMRDAGFGRLTFDLELDAAGDVVVHTLRHEASRDELQRLEGHALYGAMHDRVARDFDLAHDKVLVVTGFSGYDPASKRALAHTALGGGAVGVFSNLCMHSWPDSLADVPRAFTDPTPVDTGKVFEDVGLKDCYHLASTTIGAMLHEMGHTFGLPHTSDPRCIMSRGFDLLFRAVVAGEPRSGELVPHAADSAAWWSPAFAMRLAHSPWFLADQAPAPTAAAPTFTVKRGGDEVEIKAPAGLLHYSVHTGGTDPTAAIVVQAAPRQKVATIDFDELRRERALQGALTVIAYDAAHRELRVQEDRLRNVLQFVRRWQVDEPVAWDRTAPPLPAAKELARLDRRVARKKAQKVTPPQGSPFASVDLLALLGGGFDQSVLLRSEFRCERTGPATMLFGGDDGARIWLNGELVFSRPELAVFATDGERVPVQLQAGDNVVLVQSFQGGGGWGLSLRFVGEGDRPIPVDR